MWLLHVGTAVAISWLYILARSWPAPQHPAPPLPPCLPQLIINLKNKPEAVEKIHSFCAIYFCLYMLVFTGVSIRCGAWNSGSCCSSVLLHSLPP